MSALATATLEDATPDIGTLVSGIDIRDHLDEDFATELRELLGRRGVVVFRGQTISPADQVALTALFGAPVPTLPREFPVPGHDALAILSNIREDGKPIGSTEAGRTWHTDAAFHLQPTSYTVLHALVVPKSGGGTAFGSLRRAHAELGADELADLRTRRATYSFWKLYYGRPNAVPLSEEEHAKRPPVSHPVIRTHPHTGEECVYLNRGDFVGIDGMPEDEARALVERVFAAACAPEVVYEHAWRLGDVMIWDNRIVLHIGTPYDVENDRRLVHRAWVRGERPYGPVDGALMPREFATGSQRVRP